MQRNIIKNLLLYQLLCLVKILNENICGIAVRAQYHSNALKKFFFQNKSFTTKNLTEQKIYCKLIPSYHLFLDFRFLFLS